jgi:uncharacterized membrane protein HdeD (DUF308 family)
MTDTAAPEVKKAGGWVIAWGALLIVSGVIAIFAPAAAALATALLLAWLFVFAGAVQLVYAFQQRGHDGFGWKVVSALATLVLGIAMLMFPIASIASLALLIGAFMLASGVSSAMLAFKLKPKAGWGWVLFDGVLSIVIAILIAARWPQDSIGFVGILVGLCLISGGVWRIVLGRALRSGTPLA